MFCWTQDMQATQEKFGRVPFLAKNNETGEVRFTLADGWQPEVGQERIGYTVEYVFTSARLQQEPSASPRTP